MSETQTQQRMKMKKAKMEKNLQKLYLFYICQFPSVNGNFEKQTIENSEMNLQMFMVFVKQFNILGHDLRRPNSRTNLENKRRGKIEKIPEIQLNTPEKSTTLSLDLQSQKICDYKAHKEQVKQKFLLQQFNHIDSKHKWWNDEEEFYRYYNPQNIDIAEEKHPKFTRLDTMALMQIYKRNSFQGKSLNYDQFCNILTVIAKAVFPNVDQSVDTTLRFHMEVLFLHKTKKMKSVFKTLHHAFNISEKIGYRYDIPKVDFETRQEPVKKTSKHRQNAELFKSASQPIIKHVQIRTENKLLDKYVSRYNEVEKQEKEKQEKMQRLHDNIFAMRLSQKVRALKGQF